MVRIQPGSTVRVTGICASNYANPFGHDVPFNVLLRSTGDLELIKKPSLVTVHNLGLLAISLLVMVLLLGVRVLYVGGSTRARLAELGYLSQRRGEILEDINNAKPLPEILERITELASASLKGAPCWCEMEDGAILGNRPPGLGAQGLRVTEHAIGHAKPALGALFAAFDARTTPQMDEGRALATAAELATLAIENSRFHSELLHRSEFDMLTEIQNRFSFEKHLDALIDWTQANGGVFGLVYIDLNGFKQVNDVYGHQLGDMFLQRVARRMKHQLRAGDLLARVGGDEFGLLVPVVHKRADLEEIALRLQRCFEEPFRIDGRELYGSASAGIALYPEDATTKDGLLSAADSAMYAAKRARKSAAAHEATA
jgi:diguanylate cyclase (GGDEF)-like protein